MNLEEENEEIEDLTVTQYVNNEKGEKITVIDFLKDVFTFYKDESPSITYYAIGKQKKVYYNLGMNLSDYCKEITYIEFLEAEKNNREIVDIRDIDEIFLVALYNLYKNNQSLT